MKYILQWRGYLEPSELGVSLCAALKEAVVRCPGVDEEEGGFIVCRPRVREEGEYQFHRIRNSHTGTPSAAGLYEPDRQEYGEKIIMSYNVGFQNYASFHTHPTNCPARPSITDLTRLFNGQPVNYICSPSLRELKVYSMVGVDNDVTTWRSNGISLDSIL